MSFTNCVACRTGDLPTGLHRCLKCNKPVHLFGCSVEALGTEEGCGEGRICIECDEKNNLSIEHNAVENWKRKGQLVDLIGKKARSARSYLNQQPGFEHVDLNQKGKVPRIILLKNGLTFKNKPILVTGVGKVLVTNSCSIDSLLTLMACSAADSQKYNSYICSRTNTHKTAELVIEMIKTNKTSINIYLKRTLILLEHFKENTVELIGHIKLIDTMATSTFMANKLFDAMHSYSRHSQCSNNKCLKPLQKKSNTVISLNAIEGKVILQKELNTFFSSTTVLCTVLNCGSHRCEVLKASKHLLIELISVPHGK